jgi:hypothetical protein
MRKYITPDIKVNRPSQKNSEHHGIQEGSGMIGNQDGGFAMLQFFCSQHINLPEKDPESHPH